ncbi:MAG TPA: SPOR domain-containing protein [Saprospiraceae bacterium]|nr:SPOR domain-containing protein [Saprospiraceae bacterium]
MIGRLILWIVLAAFAIFWVMTVFKTCNKTDNPLSKAKTSIEDTFEESGLTSNDAELSDADLDEFEGVDNDATTNKEVPVVDEADEEGEAEDASAEALDDERPTSYTSSEDKTTNKTETSTASNSTSSTASSRATYSSANSSKYMVVAGTFKSKSYATSEVQRLKKMGYPQAEVVKFDRTTYHSVCAGRFNDLTKARAIATSLKKDGVDAYVHTRKGKRK